MRVAILGCGPAGLLAAHAAGQADCEVFIFSDPKPSVVQGAMYLHRAIPGITGEIPDSNIHVFKRGHREGYALKVYGDINAQVSWDKFETGKMPIWYLDQAYHRLWDRYGSLITPFEFNRSNDWYLKAIIREFDLVISTIPVIALCRGQRECQFESQAIHILKDQWCPADEFHLTTSINLMTYSGQPSEQWYRHSDIRGLASWEFSGEERPDIRGPEGSSWFSGSKPLRCHCLCWPELIRVGRYGAWDRQQLSHHAYEKTQEVLSLAVHAL